MYAKYYPPVAISLSRPHLTPSDKKLGGATNKVDLLPFTFYFLLFSFQFSLFSLQSEGRAVNNPRIPSAFERTRTNFILNYAMGKRFAFLLVANNHRLVDLYTPVEEVGCALHLHIGKCRL